MTQHSTLATDGQGVERTLTVSKEVISPEQFALACNEIVSTLSGDAAHRALDSLVTSLLWHLGYGEGMAVFIQAVAPYHADVLVRASQGKPPMGAA